MDSTTSTEIIKPTDAKLQTRIGAIIPSTLGEVMDLAKVLFLSGLFPDLANTGQAVAKILAGAEMGLAPFAALNGFHIVKGKMVTHYSTIGWRVRYVGYDYEVLEHTDELCSIQFIGPKGKILGTSSFSVNDARRAGVGKPGANGDPGMLAKIPRVMLFARAMSQGTRQYVPEAFNGMVVYEHSEQAMIEESDAPAPGRGTSEKLASKLAGAAPAHFDPFGDARDEGEEIGAESVTITADGEVYTGPTITEGDEQGELI